MVKQLEKTDRIRQLIARSYGDDSVDLSTLAVFEAVAVNTHPLRRKGGLFEAAVVEEDTLREMQAWLDAGETVALQTMHRDGIPKGKVFAGETRRDTRGQLALHALFYLPIGAGENELIRKIDTGVISEVSVGLENKHIACSACGFDFLGASATIDHIFERTCANGHTIGRDGVHARLRGISKWMELSLVDRGAAVGALILPRPRQTFQMDANSGFDRQALRLFASAELPTPPTTHEQRPPTTMTDLVKLSVDLALAQKDAEIAKAALTAAQAETVAVKTEMVSLQAKLTETQTQLAALTPEKIAAQATALTEATSLIDEFAKVALAATGKAGELPATLSERVALVREGRTKLALTLPTGGASQGAQGGTDDKTKVDYSSFKTRA